MPLLKIGDFTCTATFLTRNDPEWDGREVKTITFPMGEDHSILLQDGTEWGILIPDPLGDVYIDNSMYSLRGDRTEHRDGTVSLKMGKPITREEDT